MTDFQYLCIACTLLVIFLVAFIICVAAKLEGLTFIFLVATISSIVGTGGVGSTIHDNHVEKHKQELLRRGCLTYQSNTLEIRFIDMYGQHLYPINDHIELCMLEKGAP